MTDTLPANEMKEPMTKGTQHMIRSIQSFTSVEEISSRLALYTTNPSPLDPIKVKERFIHDKNITIMEALDETQLSTQTKAQLAKV